MMTLMAVTSTILMLMFPLIMVMMMMMKKKLTPLMILLVVTARNIQLTVSKYDAAVLGNLVVLGDFALELGPPV